MHLSHKHVLNTLKLYVAADLYCMYVHVYELPHVYIESILHYTCRNSYMYLPISTSHTMYVQFHSIFLHIIASEASFLVRSMARISLYIYMFQAVRRAVNVLNVSTCIFPQCKY